MPTYAFTVPRGAFRPSPKVDSAVLHIKDIHTPFANTEEEILFFKVIHAGFAHKRKRLAKNLESLARNVIILEACTSLGIDKNARSEDVPLETWLALANYLANEKK